MALLGVWHDHKFYYPYPAVVNVFIWQLLHASVIKLSSTELALIADMAEQQDQTEVDGSLRLATMEASQALVPESELPVDSRGLCGMDARGSEGEELVSQRADRSEGFDETDVYHPRKVILNGKLLLCYMLVRCMALCGCLCSFENCLYTLWFFTIEYLCVEKFVFLECMI